MRRWLNPFILTLSAILVVAYVYVAWRLHIGPAAWTVLALPFFLVWIVPAVYWSESREDMGRADEVLHAASYVCMGWLNFLVLLVLLRDALLVLAWLLQTRNAYAVLQDLQPAFIYGGASVALAIGMLAAFRGPQVRRQKIPIHSLHPQLEGFRIAQISDLHVGPTIGRHYVERVVQMTNALHADLIVLTGDIVDGQVNRLAAHVAPLEKLVAPEGVVFILGNHDCYSGADQWIAHFRALGMRVLLNDYMLIEREGAKIVIGGVVDPALRLTDPSQRPRPDLAAAPQAGEALRIMLAHNPALAPRVAEAGFDLQLSGHTHAGQFFPWTIAVRMVHAPHVAGLSQVGRMWVYVNAGTGTWGPPVRFGTKTEITLLTLVSAKRPLQRSHGPV